MLETLGVFDISQVICGGFFLWEKVTKMMHFYNMPKITWHMANYKRKCVLHKGVQGALGVKALSHMYFLILHISLFRGEEFFFQECAPSHSAATIRKYWTFKTKCCFNSLTFSKVLLNIDLWAWHKYRIFHTRYILSVWLLQLLSSLHTGAKIKILSGQYFQMTLLVLSVESK